MSKPPLDQHREANASAAQVDEIARTIEASGVEFVYYQGVTITGRVIGKVVPAKHLRRNLDRGVNLHRTAISDLQSDRAGNLLGGGVHAAEFTAMPDLDTFSVLPWDTTVARFFTQIYEPDHLPEVGGRPLDTDARGHFRRMHAEFTEATGLHLRSGCEPEMTWTGPGLAADVRPGGSPAYHVDHLERYRPIYQKVITYAQALGLDMIEGDYEDPGQLELNWMFDHADLTADRLVTYRQICRQVARELGITASFMPKPATGMMGNGCHHNVSLWRGEENILADPGRAGMKDTVNIKIKYREPFRPFAPSVPVERAADFVAFPDVERLLPPRFMLMVAPVRPEKRAVIPAVTHVDFSARIQTVDRDQAPAFEPFECGEDRTG